MTSTWRNYITSRSATGAKNGRACEEKKREKKSTTHSTTRTVSTGYCIRSVIIARSRFTPLRYTPSSEQNNNKSNANSRQFHSAGLDDNTVHSLNWVALLPLKSWSRCRSKRYAVLQYCNFHLPWSCHLCYACIFHCFRTKYLSPLFSVKSSILFR